MKTIKQLVFSIFIVIAISMNAQTEECGTIMQEIPAFETLWSQMDQTGFTDATLSNDKYVIKVHFWQVNPDINNSAEHPLTENQMLDAVARLNRDYNEHNIFFKYDGITEFVSEDFYEIIFDPTGGGVVDQFFQFIKNNNYYHSGSINYYSLEEISGNVAAYYKTNGEGVFATIVSQYNYITDIPTVTHEVGHFFQLLHSFDCGWFNNVCENVTRDDTDPNCFNADSAGDYVIDTNATPVGMLYSSANCTYIPNGETDDCDIAYNAYGLQPEVNNYMSYTGNCRQEFSLGQVIRMRNFIDFIINEPTLSLVESYHVSILYEPYKGEYGAILTNNPPMFQYGFDYKFYDVSQAAVYNTPSDYNDISFWYGQVVQTFASSHSEPIEHPNHTAFVIAQIEESQPRMCYNNYSGAPKDGTIIEFLDGVPNANVVITPQDSLQINNVNLIQELQPGLYNIQMNYHDGTSQQTMVLKENN